MTSTATFYSVTNLQNDSVALTLSIKAALTKTDTSEVRQAWTDTAVNSAKIVSGIAYLAANDPKWAGLLGTASTTGSIGISAKRIIDDLAGSNDINSIKAGDILSVVGGLSDLAGNFFLKPGPSFVPGVVLKGIGLGAGVAQNVLLDDTVGQVISKIAGSNTPVVSPTYYPVIKYAPDGVTPLGVSIPFTEGNTNGAYTYSQNATTGKYYKNEATSTLEPGTNRVLDKTQTLTEYSSDGSPTKRSVYSFDGTSTSPTGIANQTIGADGKSWVTAGASATAVPLNPVSATTPPATPAPIDTLGIQTDAIANSDGLTLTSTINNQTGTTNAVLRDSAGTPVLSAGSGQTLVRDPTTGVFTVTNTATQSREIYDPVTGNRLYVQANGSGFLAGSGVDANGYPNADVFFNAGGLTTNTNGSITITPVPNTDGTRAPAVSLFNPTDTYSVASNNANGSTSYAVSNRAGVLQSTATSQTFDDGTQLVTVSYPSGFQTIIATDTLGGSKQVDYPVPGDPSIQSITDRNAAGVVVATSSVTALLDENNNPIANSYSIVNRDGVGLITATGERTINPVDGSATTALISSATLDNPNGTLSVASTNGAGQSQPPLTPDAQNVLSNAASAFNDAYALIKAIQGNQPLPALASGIRLYNDLSPNSLPPQLTGVASAIGALTSLYALDAALARGDYAQAFVSGANAFSLGVSTYASFAFPTLSSAAALAELGAVGAAAQTVSTALPYFNIANNLIHGNVAGAVGDAVGIYLASTLAELGAAAGPVGALAGLVIGEVLSDFFGDDDVPYVPPAWGTASLRWDQATGGYSINAVGQTNGDYYAYNQLASLISSTSAIAAAHNAADPNSPVGLIPQRLGSVNYGIDYSSSYYPYTYNITTIDAATGQQLNPGLNYDDSGKVTNGYTGDASYFQTINQYYTANALARQAIAPLWEVQTAKLQDANGISNAGLSETERSANLGRTTSRPTPATVNGVSTLERWNPIGLDFGGHLATTALATSTIQFNVDGAAELDARLGGTASTQYQHKTSWLNSTDGFLVLDKNINGTLDNAEELFSNSGVQEQYRGKASLATWDADGNGQINSADPIYNNLLVWKDLNADGKQQSAEVSSLSALGISNLDYTLGTFTQAGQVKQMSTLSLQAETVGSSYVPRGDGIQINTNNGQQSLLVTRVQDLTAVQANQDGFNTYQNTPAIIATRGNGTTIQGLLDNDRVSNAPNAKQSRYYKNRSCLRTHLLGCGTRTYPKTVKNCSKTAVNRAGKLKVAQKRLISPIKCAASSMDMCASSYEKCSKN